MSSTSRETGLSGARAGPSPRRALRTLPIAAILILLAATGPPGPALQTIVSDDARRTGSINSSLVVIGAAFREANAAHLRPVMPSGGKIFLALDSLGDETGYYGSDQVYYIFQRIFRARGTTGFEIAIQGEGTRRRKGQAYCVAMWSYRTRDNEVHRCQIFFVLAEKNGHWSIVKIREAV